MKILIFFGATIGGLLGAWIGGMLDGGNAFGLWSIVLSLIIGPFLGIWLGYKIFKNYLG